MKSEHQQRVEEFMRAAGQTVSDAPTMPELGARQRMANLIIEEAVELVSALGFDVHQSEYDGRLYTEYRGMESLAEMVDGVVDCHWVTTAVLAGAGIPDKPFLDAVYENNMAKIAGGHVREDGKFCKPPNHPKPDIAGILERLKPAVIKEPQE